MDIDEGEWFRLTADFLKRHEDDPEACLTLDTKAIWGLNLELADRITTKAAHAKAMATLGRARAAVENGKPAELYDALGVEPRAGHRTTRPWRLIVYRYHEELFRAHKEARDDAQEENEAPYSRAEKEKAVRVVAGEFDFENAESARLALNRYRKRIRSKPDRNLEGMLDLAFGSGSKRLPFELPGPLV